MTPLILTALAVAFAFRCGMFNIGGQGQYFVGLLDRALPRDVFVGMPRPLHVLVCCVGAILGGAVWGGIAGFLKADRRGPRGDLDDHAQLDRDLGGK